MKVLGEIWSNTMIDGYAFDEIAVAISLGQQMVSETPDPDANFS